MQLSAVNIDKDSRNEINNIDKDSAYSISAVSYLLVLSVVFS